MNQRFIALALLASLSTLSGCYRTKRYPAPPPPPQQLPPVPVDGAPGPGLSRIVLDVHEGPAVVEQIYGGSLAASGAGRAFGGSLEVAHKVCVTPCVFDTKPGNHQLRFTLVDDDDRTSSGYINVDQRLSVYRHSIGRDRNSAWKGFVGWPLLLGGAVLDLGMIAAVSNGANIGGPEVAGMAFAVGITALGAWLVHGSVIEKQPGSGTQWYPE